MEKFQKAKYLKNIENCEIEKVDKRILITALEKCNNTLGMVAKWMPLMLLMNFVKLYL